MSSPIGWHLWIKGRHEQGAVYLNGVNRDAQWSAATPRAREYWAKDVTGKMFWVMNYDVGRELNGMEVLAYAAREPAGT